ncbi:hypothetical protein Mlaev_00070 [Microbacterium laevaniformans]|uniref:DUF4352 domain-containing protein n=1 Tax=Microbacterium laevaniformans TaxID=36807 RepID=A0A150HI67_9MICO|nr:hypothetical protein [Microbacterium laevaniformans]KXZ61863.1 hypothetical protein Mlaev_00070 [Microbacterium laevaniformans]
MAQDMPTAGRGRAPWIVFVVVAALLVGGVVWAVVGQGWPGASVAASPSPSWATPTPQPTVFETPAAGSTTEITKPPTDAEVALDQPAPPVDGATVQVVAVTAGTFAGQVPGEPSGDAITVSVRVVNNGATPIDTGAAGVNLTYGGDDRTPGIAVTDKTARVFPASVAPGAEATADFTFVAPLAAEGDVRVSVDLLASEPDIVFVGPRP